MTVQQFDTKNFKRNWSTYIILGLALGAMLFFGVCNPQGFVEHLDNVAGSVDGEEITQSEFSRAYGSEMERARKRSGDSSSEIHIAGQVLDQLISYRILYLEAKKLGLVVSDSEIISYLSEVGAFRDKDGKFSDEVFHNFLRGNRYSETTFMDEMRRNLTVEKLRELIVSASYVSKESIDYEYRMGESKISIDYIKVDPDKIPLKISEAEIQAFLAAKDSETKIKDYYDTHKSDYHVPEKVHVRHILVSFNGARGATGDAAKRSKDEARKRIESILAKVREKGADFSAIAKKETDEPTGKTNGGDLGFFSADAMVREFSTAAFALAVGQISDPVESPYGYHIIQNIEKKAAVDVSLEKAKHEIAENLIRQSRVPNLAKDAAAKILAALKDKKPVDDLLKEIASEWKTTDEFALNASYVPGIGNNMKFIEQVMSLRDINQILDQPIEVQKTLYIVRLHSRKIANIAALDAKTRDDMSQGQIYRSGYQFMQKFEQGARDSYEKKKLIYRNPQYLALDTPKPEK